MLYRDARLCAVDKPAGIAGVLSSEAGVDALGERLRADGLRPGRVLLVPPPRASGIALIELGAEAAESDPPPAGLPSGVRHLTYVAAIDGCRLPASGQLRLPGPAGEALEYRARRREGRRALVEIRSRLLPERVLELLARHGCPVVGDAGRGGPAATQLLLHLSGVLGDVEVRAPLPSPIESWLLGEPSRPPEQFERALDDAGVQRFWLERQCQAFRLVGEAAGDLSGLTVDRYGDFAVVATSSERAERVVEPLAEYLLSRGLRGVYLKRRLRADLRRLDPHALSPPTPIRGEAAPERLVLRQHGVSFDVRLADGASTGLFLDQRANWLRLESAVRGRSLLNLFAYTGAFTLFAAAGGASSTLSVDLSSRALGRLATNLEHNGLSGDSHRLLRHDVVGWLERAGRQQRRFDWIVLDPPSFGTRGRKVLSTARDQAGLLASAAGLLAPRGRLLCVSHQRRSSLRDLGRQVLAAAAAVGRDARVEPWLGAWDCPTLPGVSHVRSVLLTIA